MKREIDITETGAIGIQDNDVNTDDVWSNMETGRTPMPGQTVVGENLASTSFKDTQEMPGGAAGNIEVEAMISRREDRRPTIEQTDFDSYSLETEEKIKGEDEEKRRQTRVAELFCALRTLAALGGHDMKSRAERCRDEVTADTHYQQTTSDEPVEVERAVRNPFEELEREQVARANQNGQTVFDHFKDVEGANIGRGNISQLVARELLEGTKAWKTTQIVRDRIYRRDGVVQPIDNIDPFEQWKTTVVATVTTLWHPNDDSQFQVGMIQDESGESMKIVVWMRSGDKPTMSVGDTVKVEGGKVNPFKKDGEWRTSIAVTADTELTILEEGDGREISNVKDKSDPTIPPWDADSDAHNWLSWMDNPHKEVDDTPIETIKVGYTQGTVYAELDENGNTYYTTEHEDNGVRVEISDFPDITFTQKERPPLEGETMEEFKESLDIGPESKTECPECGSTSISSYQQQTGGADEGMTGFHSCANCDHSWRTGYGG